MKVSIELDEKELTMIKGLYAIKAPEDYKELCGIIDDNKDADIVIDKSGMDKKYAESAILAIGSVVVTQLVNDK